MILLISILLVIIILGSSLIILDTILRRMFHLKPIPNKKTPKSLGKPFLEHQVVADKKYILQMWEFNHDTGVYPVLFIHGWANTADSFFTLVKEFNAEWNIFLLNARNHGESDATKRSSLLQFKTDIIAAIDYIMKKYSYADGIILIGHSLGAAASLLAASEDGRVAGVASIASFSNMERFMYTWKNIKHLPSIIVKATLRYIEFRVHMKFSEISPDHTINKFKGPVLIIHGTQDQTVPFSALSELQSSASRDNVHILKLKLHTHNSMLQDKHLARDLQKFLRKYSK